MLATLAIETGLLMYTLWRYKMSRLTRLVALMLLALATFQLAEYNVCSGAGLSATVWSRIGFVSITLLPPLGLHLAHILAKKPVGWLVVLAYATAAIWAIVFAGSDWAFRGHECTGNYVIFQLRDGIITKLYGSYYYGWLLTAVWWATRATQHKNGGPKSALLALVFGYFVFLVPTATATIVWPNAAAGIPSIMCGFAVLFAFILSFIILPSVTTKRDLR